MYFRFLVHKFFLLIPISKILIEYIIYDKSVHTILLSEHVYTTQYKIIMNN